MASSNDNRTIFIVSAIAVICVAAIILVAVKASKSPATATQNSGVASAELVGKLTSIDQASFDSVGQGVITNLPTPIDAPALTKDGKPYILYAGGEFCPFCAAERWPMIVALSRFGSFSNLSTTHSASGDTYPNTPTFSFHGATYKSDYLVFDGVETRSNVSNGSGYTALDSFTAEQQKIVDTYDAAPYVAATSAGSIPFIAFGGKYISSGATFSPQLLQGKTVDDVANALKTTNDPISQGIIGAANVMTAAMCSMTNNQPSTICSSTTITQIQAALSAQTKAGVTTK
jgi:hypothetical protein